MHATLEVGQFATFLGQIGQKRQRAEIIAGRHRTAADDYQFWSLMSEVSFRIGVECAMAAIAGAIVQKLATSAAASAQAGLFHRTKLVGGVANAAFVTEELTAAEVAFCNAVGKVTAAVVVAGTRAGIAGVGEAIGSETLGHYVGDIPGLRGVVLEFLGFRDLNKATQILHFVAERAKDLGEAIDKSKAGEAPANRAVKIAYGLDTTLQGNPLCHHEEIKRAPGLMRLILAASAAGRGGAPTAVKAVEDTLIAVALNSAEGIKEGMEREMGRQHQLAADFALENAPKLNFASRLWGNDANYNFHVRHWGAFTHEARMWTRVHDLLKLGIFYPVQEVIFIARTHPALNRMR